MNLSIIARCARTGQIGLAAASLSIARGGDFDGAVRPRIGAVLVQGVRSFRLNRLGTSLLAQGYAPAHVLQQLKDQDPDHAYRQMVVMDRLGRFALHGGSRMPDGFGMHAGPDYAVACEGFGDARVGEAVHRQLEGGVDEELDLRLLRALEAAAAVPGGAAGPGLRSAAMVVWSDCDYSDLDLRVDLHADPVGELRRAYDEFKPTAAYYEERARNPSQAVSAREFAGILLQQRKQPA